MAAHVRLCFGRAVGGHSLRWPAAFLTLLNANMYSTAWILSRSLVAFVLETAAAALRGLPRLLALVASHVRAAEKPSGSGGANRLAPGRPDRIDPQHYGDCDGGSFELSPLELLS